jgi:hypothetical protein
LPDAFRRYFPRRPDRLRPFLDALERGAEPTPLGRRKSWEMLLQVHDIVSRGELSQGNPADLLPRCDVIGGASASHRCAIKRETECRSTANAEAVFPPPRGASGLSSGVLTPLLSDCRVKLGTASTTCRSRSLKARRP